MTNKIKLALLSGGESGEREISLKTGEAIFGALDKNKYEIFRYDTKTDLQKLIQDIFDRKFDLVFPALHGGIGEDGRLQGLLDVLKMPYVFSGCLASAIAMDKYKSKKMISDLNIFSAKGILLNKKDEYNISEIVQKLGLPIVVKPNESGSSVGITIVKNIEELENSIREAFKIDQNILLEQFIKGREFTVAVFGKVEPKALPVIEIVPVFGEFYDFDSKYKNGGSNHICPADLSKDQLEKISDSAIKIFQTIGCKDLARVDFILNQQDYNFYFLEINTIPGMTGTSLSPEAAKEAGMNFGEFLDKLIGFNLKNL
jgi:D-alanine-D-alanine ligase